MILRNGPRPLVFAFCASVLISTVPVGFLYKELTNLRWNIERLREAGAVARKVRTVGDKINDLMTNIKALNLDLDPSKRQAFLLHTDRHLSLLKRSIHDLGVLTATWSRAQHSMNLQLFAKQISNDWNEVRRKIRLGISREEKLDFFLKYSRDVRMARAALGSLLDRSARLADSQAVSAFERLSFAGLLVVAGLMIWVAITSIVFFGIFRSLTSSRKVADNLEYSNKQLECAQQTLESRSQQLVEAQRLGKIGDWSYRLGESSARWGPELYELLGYKPENFEPTDHSIQSRFVGNGAQLFREAQAEVLRTGDVRSIDIKFKRGDGTIGDFVLTSKLDTDADGNPVGISGTIQDISERKDAEFQLEMLAYYDPLTGLANRAMFHREMEAVLGRCFRTNAHGALLLLDLDRFKDVNDSLGHAAGDELLAKVGHLVARVLGSDHFLARLGGDEFAILVADGADRASIEQLASDVVASLSDSILLERGEVNIGTSIGIALLPRDGNNASDLLRNADLALYRAKEAGRGQFMLFEPDMSATVQYKTTLATDLRHAIAENVGLKVHYQPQIDLSSETVSGFEALMRWEHPTRGPIPPSEFIPIAESSRLICDLGGWILRHSVLQASEWIAAGEPARSISVNVSAAQIWHMDLAQQVEQVLKETELPAHLLCLELTESLFADHSEARVRSVLNELKKIGVTLALDDFGTGYSSLGYLTQLPFDRLKIDRLFVDGAESSDRSRELLNGIVSLGRGLGMTVVGEGAERCEEVSMLHQFGCHLVQGYYFARPSDADEALAFATSFEARLSDVDAA